MLGSSSPTPSRLASSGNSEPTSLCSTSTGSSKITCEEVSFFKVDPFVSFGAPSRDVADALAPVGTDRDDDRALKAGREGMLGARWLGRRGGP